MATTQNTYTGNGSTTNYSFTFPYLDTADIKVSVNGTNTTAYTLANATTVSFNTAPVNGASIRIYRQTDDSDLASAFYAGSAIRASDLNNNLTQNLYVTQEANNNVGTAVDTAEDALAAAEAAVVTADAAEAAAEDAVDTADGAVVTANAAAVDAAAAVVTANSAADDAAAAIVTADAAAVDAAAAVVTADAAALDAADAVSTADAAAIDAAAAVVTADAAAVDAAAAVITADAAAVDAAAAVGTADAAAIDAAAAVVTADDADAKANQALDAVSESLPFTLILTVDDIPGSPADLDSYEISDSTGIEDFDPLTGVPVGFVGDPGLTVRIRYIEDDTSRVWLSYFSSDPETRYVKSDDGPFLTVADAEDDYLTISDASSTYQTQAGMSSYLTTATASSTYQTQSGMSSYLTTSTASSTYQTQSGMSSYLTTASASSTYLTQSSASSTYQTQSGMSSYLTTATAASTYEPVYTITTTAVDKTLANRERCTVTASGKTITLPASPTAGSEVSVTIAGTFTDTIIARNSSNIMSLAENITIDKPNVTVTLYYVDSTRGWRIL